MEFAFVYDIWSGTWEESSEMLYRHANKVEQTKGNLKRSELTDPLHVNKEELARRREKERRKVYPNFRICITNNLKEFYPI